jgi:hypothetical protein
MCLKVYQSKETMFSQAVLADIWYGTNMRECELQQGKAAALV